jgi:acetyl-CoA carboxylase biotin carboxyl carrier protein
LALREDKLKRILDLFQDSEIEELEVEYGFWRTKVRLSRRAASSAPVPMVQAAVSQAAVAAPPVAETAASAAVPDAKEAAVDEGLHQVRSPMVGTFYRASSPESDPFVQEGADVKNGQTLCIIEAMKIMNEIPADIAGKVVDILVENGQPVEYNQPLFTVRPA